MTPLTYRNEYPTEPGWWWMLTEFGDEVPMMVTERDVIVYSYAKPPKSNLYAGPITPPERPK